MSRIKRIFNVIPSPNQHRDWTADHARSAGLMDAAALPASVDLRQPWWPASNQGSSGSCVGFATGDGLARYHFATAGRILTTDKMAIAPYWIGAKETDPDVSQPTTFINASGTYLKAALDIGRKFGGVTKSYYGSALATTLFSRGDDRAFFAKASALKFTAYFNLGAGLGASANWQAWLAQNGPVMVALYVDSQFNMLYGDKVMDGYKPGSNSGHAVCLVGYYTDVNGRLIFLIRNSWGTGWAEAGIGRCTKGYAEAAFVESYGVTI